MYVICITHYIATMQTCVNYTIQRMIHDAESGACSDSEMQLHAAYLLRNRQSAGLHQALQRRTQSFSCVVILEGNARFDDTCAKLTSMQKIQQSVQVRSAVKSSEVILLHAQT